MEKRLRREANHNIHRQSMISRGAAKDHYGNVVQQLMPGFDLNSTIFKSTSGGLKRMVLGTKLNVEWFWKDSAAIDIMQRFAQVATPICGSVAPDTPLLDFMENECNFQCEHADGSFMDHLHFCVDYCRVNFRGHSPRALLLHSILGVATNIFPMEATKMTTLQSLVTPDEWLHVQAFPSILRLLYAGELLPQLRKNAHRLDDLTRVTFRRVIDNHAISLDGPTFWVHLNYHLVHLLDFLPAANWQASSNDVLLNKFVEVHDLLRDVGKKKARVDYEITSPEEKQQDQRPLSLGRLILNVAPKPLLQKLAQKEIRLWSAKVGHSLEFELQWE